MEMPDSEIQSPQADSEEGDPESESQDPQENGHRSALKAKDQVRAGTRPPGSLAREFSGSSVAGRSLQGV